jgi:hypothetical protein
VNRGFMPEENDTPLTEEEQAAARRGQALIASAMADVRAPQSLRESIERERDRAAAARVPFWRRHPWAVALSGLAAVAVAVSAVALNTGGNGGNPSLNGVLAAAQLEPTGPAPQTLGGDPPVLAANVGDLRFPDWQKSFGVTAVGRRADEIGGRDVTTVFYRNPDGARLGYAVVSGEPLSGTPPGRHLTRNGKSYYVVQGGRRTLVTWTQQGHTCAIVAPSSVPSGQLVDLAASRNV